MGLLANIRTGREAIEGEYNGNPVDAWTAVHFAVGAGLGYTAIPFWIAGAGAVAFEFIEGPIEEAMGRNSERKINALVDIGVFFLGFGLTRAMSRRRL